jgi:hypothetical protein
MSYCVLCGGFYTPNCPHATPGATSHRCQPGPNPFEREAAAELLSELRKLAAEIDTSLVLAARALLTEIDASRGLKIDPRGLLDPMHPICIQAENLRAAIAKATRGAA